MYDNKKSDSLIFIGYSGHSFGVIEAWLEKEGEIKGYVDNKQKSYNPFRLEYLGNDEQIINYTKNYLMHISMGNISTRKKIIESLAKREVSMQTVISKQANVSQLSQIGNGTYIARSAAINPFTSIGQNCIINTSSSIDHEVIIGNNVHIAPGAVIAGGVKIADNTFIGANSIIKEGVSIGSNSLIGAGSVILSNVGDNIKIYGNPGKIK